LRALEDASQQAISAPGTAGLCGFVLSFVSTSVQDVCEYVFACARNCHDRNFVAGNDTADIGPAVAGVVERGPDFPRVLAPLRQHPILGLEVMSGIGDELPVAWMIDGFHTDDNLHQPGVMLADMLDQLGLGIGWSRNENRASSCNRLSDSLKEGVIPRGVPAPDGVCLVVDVPGWVIRVQNEPFHIGRAEMEHARFMVIDPDDGMKVMAVHGMNPFGDRIPHCVRPFQ